MIDFSEKKWLVRWFVRVICHVGSFWYVLISLSPSIQDKIFKVWIYRTKTKRRLQFELFSIHKQYRDKCFFLEFLGSLLKNRLMERYKKFVEVVKKSQGHKNFWKWRVLCKPTSEMNM